jgi:hypothetical protein
MRLHPTREKLRELSKTVDLNALSYREIGALIGEPQAQNVKHHIAQLKRFGALNTQVTPGINPYFLLKDIKKRIKIIEQDVNTLIDLIQVKDRF